MAELGTPWQQNLGAEDEVQRLAKGGFADAVAADQQGVTVEEDLTGPDATEVRDCCRAG